MKRCVSNPLLVAGLLAGFASVFSDRLDAQTFRVLHSFSGGVAGSHPQGLVLSGSRLYGTAQEGGDSVFYGMVYAINTDGTGFTNLHSFTFSDGSTPVGALILSGNTLYGTTKEGSFAKRRYGV